MDGVEFIFPIVIPLTKILIMIVWFIFDDLYQYDKKSKRVLIGIGGNQFNSLFSRWNKWDNKKLFC